MITFKNFLQESRTFGTTVDAMIEDMRKHSMGYLRNGTTIFRGGGGIDSGGYERGLFYGDTSKGSPRKSANVPNLYTLFMDNDPLWKEFPKRSRSFIASTDYGTAEGFGEVALVIPHDDALVAQVPSMDLWSAFEHELDGWDLETLVHTAIRAINGIAKADIAQTISTYAELKKLFQSTTIDDILKVIEDIRKSGENWKGYKDDGSDELGLADRMGRSGTHNLYEYFQKTIRPTNFQVGRASQMEPNKTQYGNELAIQGKANFIAAVYASSEDVAKLHSFFKEIGSSHSAKALQTIIKERQR